MLAPEFAGFIEVAGKGCLSSIELITVVAGEIEFLGVQEVGDVEDALAEALDEPGEDLAGGVGVASQRKFVEPGSVALELLEVGLEKVETEMVKRIDVPVQELGGHGIVEGLFSVMSQFEATRRQGRNGGFIRCDPDGREVARIAFQQDEVLNGVGRAR
jgi:hypothetical protein